MLSKFGIKSSTDIGITGKNGILAELRGLERGVPCDRWGEVAAQVALLVNRLNEVPEPKGKTQNKVKKKFCVYSKTSEYTDSYNTSSAYSGLPK